MKWNGCAALFAALLLHAGPGFAQAAPTAPTTAEPAVPAQVEPAQVEPAQAEPAQAEPTPAVAPAEPMAAPGEAHVRWVDGAPLREWQPPSTAAAAPPPHWTLRGSHFALGLERLTSVLGWIQRTTYARDHDLSGLDVSLLTTGGSRTPSAIPRVGFDAILDNGVSLGLGLGYLHSSATDGSRGGLPATKLPSRSTWLFAPRAGVVLNLAPSFGLWVRAGLTYGSQSDDGSTSFWDLNLEPQLVAVAAPRVAFTLGGVLDYGVTGTTKPSSNAKESPYRSGAYGLTAGVMALF